MQTLPPLKRTPFPFRAGKQNAKYRLKIYKCKKNNTYDDYDYQNEDGEYLMDYLSDYEYLTKYLFNEIEVIENI